MVRSFGDPASIFCNWNNRIESDGTFSTRHAAAKLSV
jgi:hypothetical protein